MSSFKLAAPTLALLVAATSACKGAPQQPTDTSAAAAAQPGESPPPAPATAPTPEPGAATQAATSGEASSESAQTETAGTETGEPAPPAPPPESVELPTDPASDPLRVLLGGDQPETVELLATHEHGRRRIVLYRIDLAARWYATRPDDDPLVEKIQAWHRRSTLQAGVGRN